MSNLYEKAIRKVCSVTDEGFDLFQCNCCGAEAPDVESVKHHPNCAPPQKEWYMTEEEYKAWERENVP